MSILSGLLFYQMAKERPKMLSWRSQSCQHSQSGEGNSRVVAHRTLPRQSIEPLLLSRRAAGPLKPKTCHPQKLVNVYSGAQSLELRTIMIVDSAETLERTKTSCLERNSAWTIVGLRKPLRISLQAESFSTRGMEPYLDWAESAGYQKDFKVQVVRILAEFDL